MNLNLAVAVGVSFGVGMLLLQRFEGGTDIVAIFFHRSVDGVVIALFSSAPRLLKLGFAKLYHEFRFFHRIAFSVEVGLQFRDALLSKDWSNHQGNHCRAAKRLL